MAGPHVMFGVYPGNSYGYSNDSFIPQEAVNDIVGGIFQNLFNSSGAHGPAGARMFGGGPWAQQASRPGGCRFWSECIDPQFSSSGKTCNKGGKKEEASKKTPSGRPKCPREKCGKATNNNSSFGEKKERTFETDEDGQVPFAHCFKDFKNDFHHFLKVINCQWSTAVTMKGFNSEDIKVKVDDEAHVARIHGVHEFIEGESFDRRESMRVVKLPEDIIPDSIKVSYRPGGVLVITGRRQLLTNEEEMEDETVKEDVQMEVTLEDDRPEAEVGLQVQLPSKESVSQTKQPKETEKEDPLQVTTVVEDADLQGCPTTDQRETTSLKDFISTEDMEMPVGNDTNECQEKVDMVDDNIPMPSSGNEEHYDITKAYVLVEKDGEKDPQEAKEAKPFSVELDVSNFTPEQVSVKVSGDMITVTAEDREERDGYYSMRKLKRSFPLSGNINPEDLKSAIDSQGLLTIVAPSKLPEEKKQEKLLAVELE